MANANYLSAIFPKKLNTAFNVGLGDTLSIEELAKLIDRNYEFIPKREGESEITFADTSKIREVLGWEPLINIKDYLNQIYHDYLCVVFLIYFMLCLMKRNVKILSI